MAEDWEPIKPRYILMGFIAVMIIYQALLMWLWDAYPAFDKYFLRFSLSNSDIVAIAAFALAYMSYNYFYKAWVENKRLRAMLKDVAPEPVKIELPLPLQVIK